jgi:CheY-like chemotaxis protein
MGPDRSGPVAEIPSIGRLSPDGGIFVGIGAHRVRGVGSGPATVRLVATVLVVDDDALSRDFMCTLLSFRGHRIWEAADGAGALALVARHPPDAIITDVLMPGLDGYGLARALRSEPTTRHIPIVFSTAHYGPDEIQPLADACDVRDVIFKPADPTTVLATIDALPIPGQVRVPHADRAAEIQRLTRSGTWELDPVTRTIVVSPELRDLFRLPSPRVALDEFLRRVHPDDVARITATAKKTLCSGSPGTAELRVADNDGVVHELIVSCAAAPVSPSPTMSRTLWGAAQDVTEFRDRLRVDLRVQTDWTAVRRTVDAFHRAVLPGTLPTVPGVGLAAVYLPAPERLDIGAAWYDALPVDGDRVLVSVGRVAGHDRHPAAVMGQVLAVLRAFAHDDPDPFSVLGRLNRFLTDTVQDDTFATAVVALFDPNTRRLRVANGGHPAPLVVSSDRDGDAVTTLVGRPGPALGVLPQARFDAALEAGSAELDLGLAPETAFCAYGDSLIDRVFDSRDDPAAGSRRLPHVASRAFGQLSGGSPNRPLVAQILAESVVRDMLGDAVPDDDVCVTVLWAGTGDA